VEGVSGAIPGPCAGAYFRALRRRRSNIGKANMAHQPPAPLLFLPSSFSSFSSFGGFGSTPQAFRSRLATPNTSLRISTGTRVIESISAILLFEKETLQESMETLAPQLASISLVQTNRAPPRASPALPLVLLGGWPAITRLFSKLTS